MAGKVKPLFIHMEEQHGFDVDSMTIEEILREHEYDHVLCGEYGLDPHDPLDWDAKWRA